MQLDEEDHGTMDATQFTAMALEVRWLRQFMAASLVQQRIIYALAFVTLWHGFNLASSHIRKLLSTQHQISAVYCCFYSRWQK